MSKASYEIVKWDDRLFFHDGGQYVLFDSGFVTAPGGGNSASVTGRIGPFAAQRFPEEFFRQFIPLKMADGSPVTAVFNPLDCRCCRLKGHTLTISDEEEELAEYEYFFDFVDDHLPLIEGSLNGHPCRFFFDSGARMTMFGEKELVSEPLRSYREWMGLLKKYEELSVYRLDLEFPNGFRHVGEGALVEDAGYHVPAKLFGIRAMLGIDLFRHYDMTLIAKGAGRGIALHRR